MQILSDITGKRFSIVKDPRNAGAIGAAMVALIGLGEIPGFEATKDFVETTESYEPNPENREIYEKLFKDYKRVYRSLEAAYKQANGERFRREE